MARVFAGTEGPEGGNEGLQTSSTAFKIHGSSGPGVCNCDVSPVGMGRIKKTGI